MSMNLSSALLKDSAKEKLSGCGGLYGLLIGTNIVINVITYFASFFILFFAPSEATLPGFLVANALSFVVSVFCNVFTLGTTLMYMKGATGSRPVLNDIFYGFSHQMEKALILSLVTCAVSFLPSLFASLSYKFVLRADNDTATLVLLLITAISLVAEILLSLNLALCYYLMLDYPDKTAGEIVALSFRLMKGHKGRLFYIELSFIPLILLAAISVIGTLWLIPYIEMTRTVFYFDIMQPAGHKQPL